MVSLRYEKLAAAYVGVKGLAVPFAWRLGAIDGACPRETDQRRAAGFDVIRMADHAHAHCPVFEGDQPAPPVIEPAGGDIAFIHPGKSGNALKMAEHGGTAMFLAPVLSTHLTGQKRVAAACIYYESGLPFAGMPLSILCLDERGPAGPKLNAVGLDALVEVDAFGDRILGENVIEFGPLDFKGIGLRFIKGLGEMEHL